MRKSSKIISAAAIAVLAAAGGTAFTGTGVTNTAGAAQFVGGTVSQEAHGAHLATITYGYNDTPANPNTSVNLLTLTFADHDADGRAVSVLATAGSTPLD